VTEGPRPARLPVLIADDDRDIRETLRELLELEGFTVLTARDGSEALERMRQARPGLVLLDLVMPVMDGFEVCRRRAADPGLASIPVAMVSARIGVDERVDAFDLAGYLEKPVKIPALLDLVRRYCG
jgi:CheY-like chemotaxis protein